MHLKLGKFRKFCALLCNKPKVTDTNVSQFVLMGVNKG